MKRLSVLGATLALLAASACRSQPKIAPTPDPNTVVATWLHGQFTRGELAAAVQQRAAAEGAASAEQRAAVLRQVVERRARVQLLYREAQASGLADRPEVQAWVRAAQDRVLAEDWLDAQAARTPPVAAQRVEAEVQSLSRNSGVELRRFSHIFLRAARDDARARQQARERMERIQHELSDGRAFDELARQYSDSITARGGGQVDWTPRAPLHDAVAASVFALGEGQISAPVETELGLHMFRLDGIRRPAAPDALALRAQVQARLDAEARRAAAEAERQRRLDVSGVRFDATALARPARPGETVPGPGGQLVARVELERLREQINPQVALLDFARSLVVNRLLADERRAQPIGADLQRRLDDARLDAVVSARREQLIASLDVQVTPAEVRAFYDQAGADVTLLYEQVLDLLFFRQKDPQPSAVGPVYAKGEQVAKRLRDGESFDRILDGAARQPDAFVLRRVGTGADRSLRSQDLRLYRALSALAPGEVSKPVYVDAAALHVGQAPTVLHGPGLVFVRLVEERRQRFEDVRALVTDYLRKRKQGEGVAALQQRLNEQAQIKILVAAL